MMPSFVSRRLSWLVPVLAVLLFVFSDAKPALADDGPCFQNLRRCYFNAAAKSSFWEIWAAGLDCELELVDCVRKHIIGR